jgi:iron-sulfur cluster assembly accessory protein
MECDLDISITDKAAAQLRKSMELKGIKDLGVRINGSYSGCCGMMYSLSLEESGEDDVVKNIDGIKFFVNKYSVELVSGIVIDYTDDGPGFVIYSSGSQCRRGAC